MFQAYTYYLYHVPTGQKYYGVRWANKCVPEQDLWNEYFGSSDLVKDLIKEYGKESFIAEVRKTFDTSQEARLWEERVLIRLKAPEKKEWLNSAYANGKFHVSGPMKQKQKNRISKANLGRKKGPMPEEHKETLRKASRHLTPANKGKKMSVESSEKKRAAMIGKPSPMKGKTQKASARALISKSLLGNTRTLGHVQSEESNRKRSDTMKRIRAEKTVWKLSKRLCR